MEITYLGDTTIKFKTKTVNFTVNNKINFEEDEKVIDGPGEYDIKEVSVLGYRVDKSVIYVVEAEGLRILWLGNVNHKLSDNLTKEVGNIDICIVSINPNVDEAVALTRQIEPTITIPVNFESDRIGISPDAFTAALGSRVEKQSKLSIKSADLTQEEAHVVILEKK